MDNFLQYVIPVLLGLAIGAMITMRGKKDPNRMQILSPEEFKKNMRKGQLIDIRKKDAYEKDKIKGARNFPVRYLKSKHQTKVRHDQPLFIYCQNGIKSKRAAKKLSTKYIMVYTLDGGLDKLKS